MTALVLKFEKAENIGKTKYNTFYSNSNAEIIINDSDIYDAVKSVYSTIIWKFHNTLEKGSGWVIDSVLHHTINFLKHEPLSGINYIKLPKELDHPRKGLINIQNMDESECLKRCLVRYLHPAGHPPAKIRKFDKEFEREHDLRI